MFENKNDTTFSFSGFKLVFCYNECMKWAATILLTFFLGALFFSLFHMSMGMDMSGAMTDCPFMKHGEVICPMNFADHIDAWKSAFLSVVPTVTLLLVAVGMALLVVSVAPNLLRKIKYASPPPQRWLAARTYSFSYRPLQELFSNGILHPKLYSAALVLYY